MSAAVHAAIARHLRLRGVRLRQRIFHETWDTAVPSVPCTVLVPFDVTQSPTERLARPHNAEHGIHILSLQCQYHTQSTATTLAADRSLPTSEGSSSPGGRACCSSALPSSGGTVACTGCAGKSLDACGSSCRAGAGWLRAPPTRQQCKIHDRGALMD